MGLAGVCNRLGADRIFGAGQRQQVAEFGGVEHHRGAKAEGLAAIECDRRYGDDPVILGIDGRHLGAHVQRQPAFADIGLQQGHHGRHGYLRLEGDARDPAVARIEMRLLAGFACVRAIMVPQGVAQPIVAGGAAELSRCAHARRARKCPAPSAVRRSNPSPRRDAHGVRAGRRRARRQRRRCRRRQRARRTRCHARCQIRHAHDGDGRIAVHRHPHDVDQGIERAVHQVLSAPWCSAARARSAGRP